MTMNQVAPVLPSFDETSEPVIAPLPPESYLAGESFDPSIEGGPGLLEVRVGTLTRTFGEVVRDFNRLTPGEITSLQVSMYQSGLYSGDLYSSGGSPLWGSARDVPTQRAFLKLLEIGSLHPNVSLQQVLADERRRSAGRLSRLVDQNERARRGEAPGQRVDILPDVTLSSEESLRQIYRAAAQQLLGKDPTAEQEEAFASSIKGRQLAEGQADIDEARAASQAGADAAAKAAAGDDELIPQAELDAFRGGIEMVANGAASLSGGSPNTRRRGPGRDQSGLSNVTLAQWAAEARADGIPIPNLLTPETRAIVVDHQLRKWYSLYGGDWESVATSYLAAVEEGLGHRGTGAAPTANDDGRSYRAGPPPRSPSGARIGEAMSAPRGGATEPGSIGEAMSAPRGAAPPSGYPSAREPADRLGRSPSPGTPTPITPGRTDLSPLVEAALAAMNQALGIAPPTTPGTGGAPPVQFFGGRVREQIDPAAEALERAKRENPLDAFQFSMMRQLQVLDQMMGGR